MIKNSFLMASYAVFLTALTACSQGMNWREISVKETGLQVWLPCKPNEATRQIPLSEDPRDGSVEVTMIGCEKENQQFTVSYINVSSEGRSKSAIADKVDKALQAESWMKLLRKASLQALGYAGEPEYTKWDKIKAKLIVQGNFASVSGSKGIDAKLIWFGYQDNIYQIGYYKPTKAKVSSEIVETFLASIQFSGI
jgi:hypothetical protein